MDSNINVTIRLAIDAGGTLIKLIQASCVHDKQTGQLLKFFDELNKINLLGKPKSIKIPNEAREFTGFLINKDDRDRMLALIEKYSECLFDSTNKNTIALCGSNCMRIKKELLKRFDAKLFEIRQLYNEFVVLFGGVQLLDSTLYSFIVPEKQLTIEYEKKMNEKLSGNYILVNIGTATSILHVNESKITYVQHFNIGGSTYSGLCKYVCGFKTQTDTIKETSIGNYRNIDSIFGDLQIDQNVKSLSETGQLEADCQKMDFIVSSCGKLASLRYQAKKASNESLSPNDLANSFLMMVINSCTLVSVQLAKQYKCEQILFVGSFLNDNLYGKIETARLVKYLTNNKINAVFTDDESFACCIGLFNDTEKQNFEFSTLM